MGYAINWDSPTKTSFSKSNKKLDANNNGNIITGYRYSTGWAENQKVFFAMQFSKPIKNITYQKHKEDVTSGQIFFDNTDEKLEVKVAISSVSEENALDKKYLPYQVLGEKSNHIKDLLFVSRDGIFFYNPEKKEQERAGDNIFVGKIQEINPSVISDDKNIYYLHSYDIFRKKRTKHGYMNILVSKNIGVFYLGKKKDWKKIKDIEYGTTGEIWRKDNKYYYFDNLGVYQLIDAVIYEITDNASLKFLLETNNINDNAIRELIKNKKLIAVNGKEIITASIKYKESHRAEIFLIVFAVLIITTISFILYLKWKKMKLEVKEIEEEIKRQNKKIEPLIRYYKDSEEK